MTVKQLKYMIKELPDNMEVFIAETSTDFDYTMANSGYVKKINFQEDSNGEGLCEVDVFIIDEQ